MRGKCVKSAAETICCDGDFKSLARRSALKNRVFDKMRDAVQVRWLVPGSDPEKEPQRRRTHAFHTVGEDGQAIVESGFLNI